MSAETGAPPPVWQARIVTLFPDAFPGVLGCSLTGQALDAGLWALRTIDLRHFGLGRHRAVDSPPAGGGAGLVLRPDAVGPALEHAMEGTLPGHRLICLSPGGHPFTQEMAHAWARAPGITVLCGRFEGVDARVPLHYGMTEISIGDFVLTGGEIAAQALIDATVRLIPRVVGNRASLACETFSEGLLEYPQYTKPPVWKGHEVPPVLRSGHHARIAQWRHEQAERLTCERRADLWRAYCRRSDQQV